MHPAVHGGRQAVVRIDGPLFDRGGRRIGAEHTIDPERERGRQRAMRRHPAGKGLGPLHERRAGGDSRDGRAPDVSGVSGREHVVREGESLWSIAELALETKDLRRIARYWPTIHRANRDVVGRDPSRIFPGQRLVLPPEDD